MSLDNDNAKKMERQRLGGDYYRDSTISEKEALADSHYDICDIGDCFSEDQLLRLDQLARAGDHAELGSMWSSITREYREKALENAIAYLEEEEDLS